MRKRMIYSLYKGDEFIATGTAEELASLIGIKASTIRFMNRPTYKKRFVNSDRRLVVDALGYDVDLDREDNNGKR